MVPIYLNPYPQCPNTHSHITSAGNVSLHHIYIYIYIYIYVLHDLCPTRQRNDILALILFTFHIYWKNICIWPSFLKRGKNT